MQNTRRSGIQIRDVLIAAAASITACAVVVVCLYLFFRSGCQNQVLAEVPSPDGSHKAFVFQRNCGSTAGVSTQVTVLPTQRELPNDSGNVFISDTAKGPASPGSASPGSASPAPAAPGVSEGPEVVVYWNSPISLVVSHKKSAKVVSAEPVLGLVGIRYEELPAR